MISSYLFLKKYYQKAETRPFVFGVFRNETCVYKKEFDIDKNHPDTPTVLKIIIRSLLYIVGGNAVKYSGPECLDQLIDRDYFAFEADFFTKIFGGKFEIARISKPMEVSISRMSMHDAHHGVALGLDLGGTSVKVALVNLSDNSIVYENNFDWCVKESDDDDYAFKFINEIISTLPHFDSIGISSAGVIVDSEIKISSLFRHSIQNGRFLAKRLEELYQVPVSILNDGEIAAFGGNATSLLAIVVGSDTAGGYIDNMGLHPDYINELAFTPLFVDDPIVDEWSGHHGNCGKHISRVGDRDTIGIKLAHAISLFSYFYEIKNILLLGGVALNRASEYQVDCLNELTKINPELSLNFVVPQEASRFYQACVAARLRK